MMRRSCYELVLPEGIAPIYSARQKTSICVDFIAYLLLIKQAVMKIGEALAAKGGSGGAAGGDEQKTYDADVKEDEKK